MVSMAVQAQSNSFLASGNKLVWENVFISNETNIPASISRHSKLKIVSSDQKVFTGKGDGIKNTCPETSAFMKNELSFDFEVEASDGKYRVTITNIVFKNKNKKVSTAESYFIKNGDMQTTGTLQADLDCLDVYFNRIFNTALYKNRS
jgi:hypothetical protein